MQATVALGDGWSCRVLNAAPHDYLLTPQQAAQLLPVSETTQVSGESRRPGRPTKADVLSRRSDSNTSEP
jgi:hypothetical protein